MDQKNLDLLVQTIADRVRTRLGAGAIGSCIATPEECAACGGCAIKREGDTRSILTMGATRIAAGPSIGPVPGDMARYIDHTLLKPEATREQLQKLCEEARQYNFYSVCVNSANVKFCRSLLAGSEVKVVAVVGFPLGAASAGSKAFEARQAVMDGAGEIDMVINIGNLKSRDYGSVYQDIRKVVESTQPKPVKVIIETGMLKDDEKVIACVLSKMAGARFVKTSTGFGPGGATAEDVALMKRVVGAEMEVKASGGVRDDKDVTTMLQAGATRIGASASIAIVTGKKAKSGTY